MTDRNVQPAKKRSLNWVPASFVRWGTVPNNEGLCTTLKQNKFIPQGVIFLDNVTFAAPLSGALDTDKNATSTLFLLYGCNNLFCLDFVQGQQLKLIEDQIYLQLVEQLKLHTEGVVSDVEKATTALRSDPKDLHNFSKYAPMVYTHSLVLYVNICIIDRLNGQLCCPQVKESAKMLADIERRVEYIHSLQETLDNNYREMTKEEIALEEKVQLSTRSVNSPAFFVVTHLEC